MRNPTDVIGIDYTLYFNNPDGTVSDIEYKGQARALTAREKAILKEIGAAGNATKEYFETRTYAQVFGLVGDLPPVDVVATKPTSAAAGSNVKILLIVVGVAAALILFNK